MVAVLLLCESHWLQCKVESATWNLLNSLLYEFQLNWGKSDKSLEDSLVCRGDLSSAIRKLVSDCQISPSYNDIQTREVF